MDGREIGGGAADQFDDVYFAAGQSVVASSAQTSQNAGHKPCPDGILMRAVILP